MADIESNININIDTSNALANIKQLQAQISAFHQSMAKGSASSNAQLASMQQNLVNMINQTGNFSAQIKNVATTTETFTNALEKNKLSMGQYFHLERWPSGRVGC
jgi:phage-related protein